MDPERPPVYVVASNDGRIDGVAVTWGPNGANRHREAGTLVSGGGPTPGAAITQLLAESGPGESGAFEQLLPLVYEELRSMAVRKLRHERPEHTLNATALVHEAYMMLVDHERVTWQSRGHFFAVASEAMRRILVNHARDRNAQKRGGRRTHVPLEEGEMFATETEASNIAALGEALDRLDAFDPRAAKVVTYRFFGGLKNSEIASVLGVAEITVRRDWQAGRAWLRLELAEDWEGGSPW